jgi:hypothetical protein
MKVMKQTAVGWLEIVLIPDPISEEDFEHNINCWKQAKKMEKKQMIDFAFVFSKDYTTAKEMRDYYKETFNTK